MSPRLYLHVGAQKTGTTSIQAALSEHRAGLAALGFCYPQVEPNDPNTVSHYNSFRGFFAKREDQVAATDRFVRRVRDEPGDLILSAECLSAWPPPPGGSEAP